jgi:hypothetical protein
MTRHECKLYGSFHRKYRAAINVYHISNMHSARHTEKVFVLFERKAQHVLMNVNLGTFCSSQIVQTVLEFSTCVFQRVVYHWKLPMFLRRKLPASMHCSKHRMMACPPCSSSAYSTRWSLRILITDFISEYNTHCFLLWWRHFAYSSCVHSAAPLSAIRRSFTKLSEVFFHTTHTVAPHSILCFVCAWNVVNNL